MADDLSLIVGEIRGAQKLILDRLDRSDEQTDAKTSDLAGQIKGLAAQHETDKAEAIKRGNDSHGQTQVEIRKVQEAATLTGGRVSVLEKTHDEEVKPLINWYHDEGSKLGSRVSTLEQAEVVRTTERARAEKIQAVEKGKRIGAAWVWGLLGAAVMAIGSFITVVGLNGFGAVLEKIGRAMGGN